jgi:lipoate-protein ligase A
LTNEYSFKFAFTPGLPGVVNMGIDFRLAQDAVHPVPVVRFFTWKTVTISIGYNQAREKRIDLDRCRRDGIEVVRRPTGGRELLHGHDLCYSVVWPAPEPQTTVEAGGIFVKINDILVSALRRLNVKACWHRFSRGRGAKSDPCFALVDRGEISVGERKLLASAQRVFGRAVLQQGSMPLTAPAVDLIDYLTMDDQDGMRDKLTDATTCLCDHIDETFPINSIVEMFKGEFERFFRSKAGTFQPQLEKSDSTFVK